MPSVRTVISIVILCVSTSVLLRVAVTSLERWPLPQSTDFIQKKQFTDQTMKDIFTDLFWFIQISDIHISAYRDLNRGPDLKSFTNKNVAIMRPEVVIVSGDLTDGRQEQYFSSSQLQSEWDTYKGIISDTAVTNWTVWLDLPGNHDTFDVSIHKPNRNYYRSHGVQGKRDEHGYIFTLNKPYGQYSFVIVDLSPRTGIKFPLNFFGDVTSGHEKHMNFLANSAAGSNQTFWFGHYPTSTVIPSKADFRSILGKHAFAYLCGHLHTLLGLEPRLYTIQPHGFLELELGDWRDERIFRVVAVDHDLVSFADYKYHGTSHPYTEWPIVLITNPKDATFMLPHKEPVQRIANSTHIRILAWSPWPIASVSVEIDGVHVGNANQAASSTGRQNETQNIPLYVLPWQPSAYAPKQSHWIVVTVEDAHGNRRITKQPFVVDGQPLWQFSFLARLILYVDHAQLLKMAYYLMWSVIAFSLLLPRCLPHGLYMYCMRKRMFKGWCRLSTTTDLQVPILLYLVYSLTCPLYMGFLLTDHFGVVFSYGVLVAGSFILESLSYFYEICQLSLFSLTVLLGLSLYLGCHNRRRPGALCSHDRPGTSTALMDTSTGDGSLPCGNCAHPLTATLCSLPWPLIVIGCVASFALTVLLVVTVVWPYGWLAGILSPGRLGVIPLTWFLVLRAAAAKI